MPLTDQQKDATTLLADLHAGIPGNLTAMIAKVEELQYRIIAAGDSDDIVQGDTPITRGGVRPLHKPIVA